MGRFRVGNLVIDTDSQELISADGSKTSFRPQEFGLLNMLVERAGEVVKREEIEKKLWPGKVPSITSLNGVVFHLRRKLRDLGGSQPFIEVVGRVGYRLVAPVEPFHREERSSLPMLAVLPFGDWGSGQKLGAWDLNAMTVEMIRKFRLLASGRLNVLDWRSVSRYNSAGKSSEDIGRDLKVAYIFEATVRREGPYLHVQEHLTSVADRAFIWGASDILFERDTMPLQRDLAKALAQVAQIPLTEHLLIELEAKHPVNLEARDGYFKGRESLEERTEQGIKSAIEHFKAAIKSIEKDSNYGKSFARLADAYALLGLAGFSGVSPREMLNKGKAAANRALEINPGLAEAHAALGEFLFRFERKWSKAEVEFKRAIDADPNYPTAHHWYSIFLNTIGRREEAKLQAQRACELSQQSAIIRADSAWPFFNEGNFDEAIARCDSALEIKPDFWLAHLIRGLALEQKTKHSDAIHAYHMALRSSPDDARILARIAYTCAVSGRKREAQKTLRRLQNLEARRPVSPYFMATAYAGLGQKGLAINYLQKSFKEGWPSIVFMKLDPSFTNLRSMPKFKELLSCLRLP